jgi:hypothetical protein
MTRSAREIVAELAATGLSPDQLILVAELAVAAAAEAGKSKHAQAQARYKAKKRVISSDQRMISADHSDHQTPPKPPSDRYLLPSSSSLSSLSKKESKKAIMCPPDWTPSEKGVQFATDHGFTPEHITSEVGRFRDYQIANGKKYLNLDAAWRNWVTSPYQGAGPRARSFGSPVPRPGSREDRAERTYRAQQELKAFANGDHADDAQPSGGAGRPDAGLLPFGKSARS